MSLKRFAFRLLGKDPEAVVVSFCSGPPELAIRMVAEVRQLVPDRGHYAVAKFEVPGVTTICPDKLPGPLRSKRIGLAPTLFTGDARFSALRSLAFRMAPGKVLAYNRQLERHHLRLRTPIASLLFLKGVPLDRIWLRPSWLVPWKRDRSVLPDTHRAFEGRTLTEGRPRIAVLSPYFPYPLSHGGAVRMFNLLREAARDFDVFLFAFAEKLSAAENTPVLDYCAKVVLFPNPRYREPRWSSLRPPEVAEFRSSYVARTLADFRRRYELKLLQVEYTQMASYAADVLVEHDVTFDLYSQVYEKERSLRAWWDLQRWKLFERRAIKRFPRVVVMSEKDADLLSVPHTEVIPNGVDLARFRPEPESDGSRVLFIGSFAHFPNVVAYRWFVEHVMPLVSADVRLTVIAGKNPELYISETPTDARVEFHGFISDVRPFYVAANLVVVPTRVSAGTNLKVLEAMAMERAVLSTTSGCAGLGLRHGESVWVADSPEEFASAIQRLLGDFAQRQRIARAARRHAELNFGWDRIGYLQRRLWMGLLRGTGIQVRSATVADLPDIQIIQSQSYGASHWDPETYFQFDVRVAERQGNTCGFMVSRSVGPDEVEVLNLAVAPPARRCGAGAALLETLTASHVFLEVRESNTAAKSLYEKLGFRVVGRREEYYDDPPEAALVMRRSRSGGI